MTIATITETDRPSYDDLARTLQDVALRAEALEESVANLAREDIGWEKLTTGVTEQLSRHGLNTLAQRCRLLALASPLIKRGLQLRNGYVWGQGVTIQARTQDTDTSGTEAQDVNAVVQAFLDDESNQAALTGSVAREELERALGTDGNIFIALFTNPLTGRVQVRTTPFEEVTDRIDNPEDRDDPWFYLRQWTTVVIEKGYGGATTRSRRETRRALHPALGYWPTRRPRTIDGIPVLWDQPIIHVAVNRLDGWTWGVPDAYASIAWARAYDEFLTDWARLMKALSKFAWKLTGDTGRSAKAAQQAMSAAPVGPAGGVASMGANVSLEAIPKSGATIDAESGKPLAAMVAAGLGVPVTMLLADPGTTGARAVAETLDKPTILEMGQRRALWTTALTRILGYVIAQAIKAPRGPLRGTVTQDGTRQIVTLAGDLQPRLVVTWPPLDELDPVQLVSAIVSADSTGKMPPLETVRLLLTALSVEDVDDVLATVTDENGDWIDRELERAAEAVGRKRAELAARETEDAAS